MGGATCILCVTVLICLLSTTAASTSPTTTNTTTATQATTATTITKETTTTTKSQSTEAATQTTTTEAPILGANCSSNSTWCNSTVGARCLDGKCVCEDQHFMKNSTTCLPETALKPLNLTVNNVTSTSVILTWSVNSSVQNLALNLFASAEIGEPATDLSNGSCNVSQTTSQNMAQKTAHCTGLVPGYFHNFTVRVAFNNASSTESTRQALYPAIPGEINLQGSSAPNVTLKFRKSAGKVDQYKVIVTASNIMVEAEPVVNNISEEVQVNLTKLLDGTNYTVNITAISHKQPSLARIKTFRTNTAVPGPPEEVSVSNITKTSMKVSWVFTLTPNGDIRAHNVCTAHKIYDDTTFIEDYCQIAGDGNITSLVMNNLTAGAYYQFSVYTVNDMFTSNNSTNSRKMRTLQSVPGQINNLTGIPHDESIFIAWNRPLLPNGDIITYQIKWSEKNKGQEICLVYLKSKNSSVVTYNSLFILEQNNSCNVTEPEPIEVNQHNMTYNITNLQPNIVYNITVTAYTVEGPGKEKTIEKQTSVAVPEKVTNVHATVLNATAVRVSWTIPMVNPGPVNYSATAIDLILKNTGINASCTVTGYNSSSCEIGELEEFWMYKFIVVGKTDAGTSVAAESSNITTDSSLPGMIPEHSIRETFYTTSGNCDATMLTFHWEEPNLHDRNCNITKYVFDRDYFHETKDVSDPDPYRKTNRNFDFDLKGLKPEESFTFTVHPVCDGLDSSNNPNLVHRKVEMGACAPPPWTKDKIEQIKEFDRTPSSFTIKIPENLFSNKEQGSIKEKGLVIIPYGTYYYEQDPKTIDVERLAGYENASSTNPNFKIEYKITLISDEGNEMKIQIGKDGTCSKTHGYCNGPLPAEFTFKLAVYACTNHKSLLCTVSSVLGPYTTKASPAVVGSSTGWIIAVAILVVLGVVLGAFAFLWYRGVIDPKKWIRRPGQGGSGFTPIEEIRRNRPILIGRYPSVLQEMHKDTNLILAGQYDDINKLGQMYADRSTSDAAREESNTPKNRWVNILPFDHSRVKLQQIDDDDPTTDYINANYMPGFNNKREYIATQGPLPGTIDDFWRMVWEHNVSVIVMLTQCKEGNRVKCEKYWPDELREPKQYDEVVVNPVSISTLDKYNISIFNVSVNNDMRQVIHFHYLDFPDFSANVEYEHFINFVRTVRSHVPRDMKGPMVVHCSAGVGRTGTFIIIDRLNLYLNSPDFSEGDEVDIFDMVAEMRENRVAMVQTESQYIMIHDCFEKMLEDKKKSMEQTELQDNPYENVNKAFDTKHQGKHPFPDVLYENVKSTQNTEL